ncbi:hypothetical protein Landi51_13748 [Colletotrichum acutatum]
MEKRKDVIISAHNYLPAHPSAPVVIIAYSAWPTEVVSFRDMVPCWAAWAASLQKPRGGCIPPPNLTHLLARESVKTQNFKKSSPTSERVGESSAAPQARRSRKMKACAGDPRRNPGNAGLGIRAPRFG